MSQSLLSNEIRFQSTNDIIKFGLEHNAQLKSKKKLWEAEQKQSAILSGLPDPQIGIRLNGAPSNTDGASFDQKRFIASQSFPFFGERTRLVKLGEKHAELAYYDYVKEKNELTQSILNTLYDYYLTNELMGITQKNKVVLDSMINIADVKYRSGSGLQANVLKAKVLKGKYEERYLFLAHEKTLLLESLKSLLNISEGALSFDGSYPGEIELGENPDIENWVTNTLVMKQESLRLNMIQHKVNVEKDRFLPDFTARIEYWDNVAIKNQVSGQFMMTFPWLNSKNTSVVKRAKDMELSSIELLKDTKSTVRSLLITLVSDIQTTSTTLRMYDESVLKDARLALSNFQKAFEVGNASFSDYVESEQTLFELEENYAKLKNRYFTQLATLMWQFEEGRIPNG
jgi:outer membrane protein TolC